MMTEDLAKKYFGDEDPMDKMVRMDARRFFKVTGIFKPLPINAHFHPEILVSFNTLNDTTIYGKHNLETNWGNNAFYTYLMLPGNYPVNKLESRFPAFLDKYVFFPGAPPNPNKPSTGTKLSLQKLTDIHLGLISMMKQNPMAILSGYMFSAVLRYSSC